MFRSKRSADDFAAEIKAHLELEADQLRDEGLNTEAARRQAYRAFGSVRAAQESFYIRGRLVWLDNLFRDLQFAARQIRRSPGFTFTAVLILTLGIAANVIVFGLLQGVVLAPLDVPRPDRVVTFAPQDGAYPIAAFPEVRGDDKPRIGYIFLMAPGLDITKAGPDPIFCKSDHSLSFAHFLLDIVRAAFGNTGTAGLG